MAIKLTINMSRPCATHTSLWAGELIRRFQPAVPPVAGHCYLFGGLYGQVGWSLGITKYRNAINIKIVNYKTNRNGN